MKDKFWKMQIKEYRGGHIKGGFTLLDGTDGKTYYIKSPRFYDDLDPSEWLELETVEIGFYFIAFVGFFPTFGNDHLLGSLAVGDFAYCTGQERFICDLDITEKMPAKKIKEVFLKKFKAEYKTDKYNGKLKAGSVKIEKALFFRVCDVKQEPVA